MQMQSLFVAYCHFSDLKHQKNNSYPRSKIFRRHVYSGCSAPLPLQLPSLSRGSSIITLATNDSSASGEGISIQIEQSAHHPEENDPSMLLELMSPISSAKPDQMSASSLAYLGDVLFELFVRSRYIWPSRRMSDLQNKVVSVVRGKISCEYYDVLHRCATFRSRFCPISTYLRSYINHSAEAQSLMLQK